mgnify:CR=1 FL=1
MWWLALAVLCSVAVSVLFRLAPRWRLDVPQAVTWNYLAGVLLAVAVAWGTGGAAALATAHAVQLFLGFATALLALQKLRDIEGFVNGFLGYDMLAQRVPRYARVYPWAEALVGLLMISGAAVWLMAPLALVIGGIGAVSVFKAVYVDRRELKCACVGGQSNVPLGFVSLTENLVMIGMAVWMVARMM